MRRQYLPTTLTILFLVVAFVFLTHQRLYKPRVFILHSYNKQLPWVKHMDAGMDQWFNHKAYISFNRFYMDSKQLSSKRTLGVSRNSAVKMIRAWKPDILIALDGEAESLVKQYFMNDKKMNIIMAGLLDPTNWSRFEQENVAGVTEQLPIAALKEIFSMLLPNKKKLYYLSDDSGSAQQLEPIIAGEDWGDFELVKIKRANTLSQWKKAVLEANQKADILLISVYFNLKGGDTAGFYRDLIAWTNQNSRIPSVGLSESFMQDGGLITIAPSAVEQGYLAAWLALHVLEKKLSLSEVTLLHGKTFSLCLQKKKIREKFPQIQISQILDALSSSHCGIERSINPETV